MKYIFTLTLLFISGRTFSQIDIELRDISKHIGDSVKVVGKIYGGKYLEQVKGSPTFLNVGGDYPDVPLTLVIWSDVRKQFYQQMPEVVLKGKECWIYGKVELYKGRPQMVIHNPSQIHEPVKVDVN